MSKQISKPTVIMISTDTAILKDGSAVQQRMREYGGLFVELHIVLFSKGLQNPEVVQIGQNILVYPTRSHNRWWYVCDAFKLGKQIVEKLLARQSGASAGSVAGSIVVSTQDSFETGLVGKWLMRRYRARGLRLNVQVHTDFLSPYFGQHSFLNWLRLKIARGVLPLADSVRVVSERIKRSLVAEYQITAEKISVLPIYTQPFSVAVVKKYPQFDFVILMVCRLAKEKNVSLALAVFSDLVKKHPKAGLVIVGDGPEKPKIVAGIVKLGLDKNVILEGWQTDLSSFYGSAQAFLSTSFYEGYGMAMIEAASAGLPIVTTDVGVAGDILINEKSALVCAVGDRAGLLQALSRLIEDLSLRGRLKVESLKVNTATSYKNKEEYLGKYQENILVALK